MSYDVPSAIERVRERIERACARAGRDPTAVALVAVSKAHPEEAVRAAYAAGLRVFGENYAQELAQKASALSDLTDLQWRFIGHLQRNKIKLIVSACSYPPAQNFIPLISQQLFSLFFAPASTPQVRWATCIKQTLKPLFHQVYPSVRTHRIQYNPLPYARWKSPVSWHAASKYATFWFQYKDSVPFADIEKMLLYCDP